MTDLAIEIKDLSFDYGNLLVIRDLSLAIPGGLSFGLLGPNGSGKTTLIRLIGGLLRPGSGNIRCLGGKTGRAMAKLIGYMPQLPSLYSELSVEQNVDFFAHIYGIKDREMRSERVVEVINLVDLWDKRKEQITRLSGGMKQRTSLACAIVHRPRLILLDEPTVGLDPELRVRFWEYFASLTKSGATIIISSHSMDDAAHCDQLAFLRQGKVIALGTPAELRAATGNAGDSLEDAFVYFIRRGEVKTDAG